MAQHKPGFFTASTISPLLTGVKKKLLKGGVNFAESIALERLGIIDENSMFTGNRYTEWGNAYEPEAISVYEQKYFVSVKDRQKVFEQGFLSCTVDGCIGDKELLEVKCPAVAKTHLGYLKMPNLLRADYSDQCQFQLMITGRDKCNLISYDPRFPDHLKLVHVKIYADFKWQEKCMDRVEQAEEVINNLLKQLNQLKG